MRKLNYDIKVGTQFKLSRISWQVDKVAGNYEIRERKTVPDYEGDTEIEYICINLDHPWQNPVRIAEMTLAYILGEDVEGKVGVIYNGKEYQPTVLDDFRVATQYDGIEEHTPFWYLGYCGNGDYSIDVDFNTGEWCFFTLPWD